MSNMRRQSTQERFWANVKKAGGDECWEWQGIRIAAGYGLFSELSHRMSYMLTYGEIPKDKPWIMHKCDNRACVRPDHLTPGTPKENTQDMIAKGRHRFGGTSNRLEFRPRKETHNNSKLTEAQVEEIRELRRLGETTVQLAKAYGVSQSQISRIVLGESWGGPGAMTKEAIRAREEDRNRPPTAEEIRLEREKETQRFWSFVEKTDSCWLWHGYKNRNGYPIIKTFLIVGDRTRDETAARVAYSLTRGPIEKGSFIKQTCDNVACCNPDHMEQVSKKQLVNEAMKARGLALVGK